jgi:hypothetical protein
MQTRIRLSVALFLLGMGLLGCNKKSETSATSSLPTNSSASVAAPVMGPIMKDWLSGNQAAAVSNFVQADWKARPLFPAGSRLNLTEDEFRSQIRSLFTPESVNAMGTNLYAEIDPMKRLAAAVGQAGQQAAAQHDYAKARKYFTALQQCGDALDGTNSLALVKMVGQGLKKRAETELSKLPQ